MSGWNVGDDFNFDSYLMREIELTLFKYFNASPGFLNEKSSVPEKRLAMMENLDVIMSFMHIHTHFIAMMI